MDLSNLQDLLARPRLREKHRACSTESASQLTRGHLNAPKTGDIELTIPLIRGNARTDMSGAHGHVILFERRSPEFPHRRRNSDVICVRTRGLNALSTFDIGPFLDKDASVACTLNTPPFITGRQCSPNPTLELNICMLFLPLRCNILVILPSNPNHVPTATGWDEETPNFPDTTRPRSRIPLPNPIHRA